MPPATVLGTILLGCAAMFALLAAATRHGSGRSLRAAGRTVDARLAGSDDAGEGVLLVDAHGNVALANQVLRELMAMPDEQVGCPAIQAVNNAAVHDLVDQARRQRGPAEDEIAVGGARPRKLLVRVKPLQVPRGALLITFREHMIAR